MAANHKSPPILDVSKNYEDWKKLSKIWQQLTSLDSSKQGPAVVLTLEGEAQQAALEISSEDLSSNTGVNKIIERLDTIYKKDELVQRFDKLESFESYKRPNNLSMRDFLAEFELKYNRIKNQTLSDDLIAYRLLKAANLQEREEQLIKATVSTLSLSEVKKKLLSVFSQSRDAPSREFEDLRIKPEASNTFYADENDSKDENLTDDCDDPNETMFTPRNRNKYRYSSSQQNQNQTRRQSQRPQNPQQPNWRDNDKPKPTRGTNPPNRMGQVSKCAICGSVYHWAQQCPDKDKAPSSNSTYLANEFVLQIESPKELESLVAESWDSALLDCGATKTVCGQEWLDRYIDNLCEDDTKSITTSDSKSSYRFGDGKPAHSIKSVKIPAIIGNTKVSIITDVVLCDIPLLLSRSSMKKANFKLDFTNDCVNTFGQTIILKVTSTGHYALPITPKSQVINDVEMNYFPNVILNAIHCKDKKEIAKKLHKQFAHAPYKSLIKLLDSAGKEWSQDRELKQEIQNAIDNCETCQKYKRNPQRPVVGLPMATKFLETVAMDLKFFEGKIILHLIDHLTRLSNAIIIPDKRPKTVISAIMKNWISIYGASNKFLFDNGGEFANHEMLETAEQFGITIKTTAAESPWSNGLVERHNQTLANMVNKVLDDTNCGLEIALAWSVNAKNSLHNVHGFSPYQLALGYNPKLPSTLNNELPSMNTNVQSSKILRDNLNALHSARKAFIESENSERIKRALNHNIRSSGDTKYMTGDVVFYKRNDSQLWKGPGTVIGQDGQQILIKHGSTYVRVHPCRIQLKHNELQVNSSPNSNTTTQGKENCTAQTNQCSETYIQSDSESDTN